MWKNRWDKAKKSLWSHDYSNIQTLKNWRIQIISKEFINTSPGYSLQSYNPPLLMNEIPLPFIHSSFTSMTKLGRHFRSFLPRSFHRNSDYPSAVTYFKPDRSVMEEQMISGDDHLVGASVLLKSFCSGYQCHRHTFSPLQASNESYHSFDTLFVLFDIICSFIDDFSHRDQLLENCRRI